MKKLVALVLAALAVCTACAGLAQTELVVFAAASMTETLTEIGALYEAAHPDVTLTFNFDSEFLQVSQIIVYTLLVSSHFTSD